VEAPMTDTIWLGAMTVLLLGYLLYALLVPEKF
jgi:K+-transporting ATPase KdpF subunit